MNIFYGIDKNITFKEIDVLIGYGVTEFFLGIIPPEWRNKYGWEVSLNKRTSKQDNFINYKEPKKVIEYIKSKNKKTYIALNDFYYTKEQLHDIKNIVSKIEKLNPNGYIIGDISLILQFEKWGINKPIHISITAGCLNQYSVNFFKRFKHVKRVNLPRYLSLKEIKDIRNSTNLELCCFAITGGCEFGEEYCFTFHSDKREIFCNRNFKIESISKSKNKITRNISKTELRCGLCAIYYFEKIGINSVKFPSRGHTINTFNSLKLIPKACSCKSLKEVKRLQKDPSKCENYNHCSYDIKEIEE